MTFAARSCSFLILAVVSACASGPRTAPDATPVARFEPMNWKRLPGWRSDDTVSAWPALVSSCSVIHTRPEWQEFCASLIATSPGDSDFVRAFLEQHLVPYRIVRVTGRKRENRGLVTGYYEPLLRGSRERSEVFSTPLYRRPNDLLIVDLASVIPELKGKRVRGRLEGNTVVPYYSRARTHEAPGLAGHEIVWIDDPLEAFLLEVQGSGRVQLNTGEIIRLQYEDQNGHPYRSIGKHLVDEGAMTLEQVNIPTIRAWLAENPLRLRDVLNSNPSVVFFRETPLEDPSAGPKGAQGIPLTAGRSIAVDPRVVPLGAPVFLSTTLPVSNAPLQRLVVAQDTGGAIRGPIRADLFFGFGVAAGEQAGLMKQEGQMWLLWPKSATPPR
jgi:membrane-bound lytic murein transglycosylase A